MQRTSDLHEIVCGDDASTDATTEHVENFNRSNERIRIIENTSNLGMHKNWERTINACKGEYIAICEGDDVWIDHEKLQKQIDLLEKNPEASACFTNANVIDSDGNIYDYPYVDKEFSKLDASTFFELNFNPIPTCTVVFRKSAFIGFPPAYFSSPFADWILHSVLMQHGPYVYLSEVTASYRKHSGGVWTGIQEEKQLQNKLKALYIIRSIVDPEYKVSVEKAIGKQLDKLLYFYREQKKWGSYLRTWIKLKLLQW